MTDFEDYSPSSVPTSFVTGPSQGRYSLLLKRPNEARTRQSRSTCRSCCSFLAAWRCWPPDRSATSAASASAPSSDSPPPPPSPSASSSARDHSYLTSDKNLNPSFIFEKAYHNIPRFLFSATSRISFELLLRGCHVRAVPEGNRQLHLVHAQRSGLLLCRVRDLRVGRCHRLSRVHQRQVGVKSIFLNYQQSYT